MKTFDEIFIDKTKYGVKVLRSKDNNANYKYLYYALKNAKIPNTGYNRHFKWLKEVKIKYPDREKQDELSQFDDLIKFRFVEMFYDKGYPVLKWNDVFNTTTGKLDSNAAVEDGKYSFFTCSKEVLRIDKFAFDQEALLLAGNNAAGK